MTNESMTLFATHTDNIKSTAKKQSETVKLTSVSENNSKKSVRPSTLGLETLEGRIHFVSTVG